MVKKRKEMPKLYHQQIVVQRHNRYHSSEIFYLVSEYKSNFLKKGRLTLNIKPNKHSQVVILPFDTEL